MPPSPLKAFIFVTALWIITRPVQAKRRRSKLPPGPSGWPVIGSVLSWPSQRRWLTFTDWGRTYGDLTYANLVGSNVIIINSLSAATALLDKKGANFSDRPSLRFLNDIAGWGEAPVLMNLGPTLTGHRRRMIQLVGSKQSVDSQEDTICEAVLKCLNSMMEDPPKLGSHIRLLNGSIALSITYGYTVSNENDKFVTLAEKVVGDVTSALVPGAFLVDTIPALQYIPSWAPGGKFKKIAAAMIKDRERFLTEPYNFAIEELAAGRAKNSFIATHSAGKDLSPEQERLIKLGAMQIYAAGSDTSISGMKTFVLCMLLNPSVQQRAQAEIDKVVGHDRLPTLADRSDLPYLNACLKESSRWAPVTPEGVAHLARTDDEYSGYLIPAGTIMIPNVWAMAHNTAVYPDPLTYQPERFLGPNPEPDPDFTFGFGRRVCPGQLLAQTSAYIFAAHLLAFFDIVPARDPDGKLMEVKVEFNGYGTVALPNDFPFECIPRSEKAKALFVAALEP